MNRMKLWLAGLVRRVLGGDSIAAANEGADMVTAFNAFEFGKDWEMRVPYGDWPVTVNLAGQPTRVLQRVDAAAVQSMADAFNSAKGKVQGLLLGYPIFKGHPDLPGWKPSDGSAADMKRYGAIEDITAGANCVVLAANYKKAGRELIQSGNTRYHSPHWGMVPTSEDVAGVPVYRPAVLYSVGLTDNPNIPVPAVNEAQAPAVEMEPIDAGDEAVGHEFHGNQYTGGEGTSENLSQAQSEWDDANKKLKAADPEFEAAREKWVTGKLPATEWKAAGDKWTSAHKNFLSASAKWHSIHEKIITAGNVSPRDAATATEPPHVMAARHSADAFRATHSANTFDGGHDHYSAAVAHHKAAKSQKAAGNDAGAMAHKKAAMFHMEQATAKAKAANEAAPEAIDWSAIPDPDAGLIATLSALFNVPATAADITAFISGVWANVLAVLNATEGLEDAAGMQEAGNTTETVAKMPTPDRIARALKTIAAVNGDYTGHPFHGNQWTGASGSGDKGKDESKNADARSRETKGLKKGSAEHTGKHFAAKQAHEHAAKTARDNGDDERADYHNSIAAYHGKQIGLKAATNEQELAAAVAPVQTKLDTALTAVANERAARAELVVDAAIAKGKLVAGHRAGWLAQFKQDFDGTLRAVNSALPFMKLVPKAEHLAQRAAIGSPGSARQNWLAAVNERMATDATILAYPAEQHWTMAYAVVRKQRPDLWEAMNKEGAPGK